ncbi:heterokaryon incompatibility protein-domain-containing protein [Dichomitus squalens]|uniref:Heterokaryon incompatibility protein-domain-containing protein n=2 Tax=Dichomitus squalens TaxID=114155 RepID=A0A4Q9PTS2_9APHY|nr:heterokaryon incompatibility protein-domain-containing protein [Dichomitus squalens]TBU57754.1 heterokaryon incompatibility protein-domain-containing protein [Dichomitus squalens]
MISDFIHSQAQQRSLLGSSTISPGKMMRVLDTHTGEFKKIHPTEEAYAILSHTWDPAGEQSYHDLRRMQSKGLQSLFDHPDLSPKIREACSIARSHGYRYIWIDSCCIDKQDSIELSEAINTMFFWYSRSNVCYAYLVDVPNGKETDAQSRFHTSRWFSRGWTLQELIAPRALLFLSRDWQLFGTKAALSGAIEKITGIELSVLKQQKPLSAIPVIVRMAWAAKRETEKVEDRAYSLFGIFDVHLPMSYGEGDRAFFRLQAALLQTIPDQTIFAWGARLFLESPPKGRTAVLFRTPDHHASFVATTPQDFVDATRFRPFSGDLSPFGLTHIPIAEFRNTPYGMRTQLPSLPISVLFDDNDLKLHRSATTAQWYLLILSCEHPDKGGHLVARVCFSDTVGSHEPKLLQRGFVLLSTSRGKDQASLFDTFILSPTEVQQSHSKLIIDTVYLPFIWFSSSYSWDRSEYARQMASSAPDNSALSVQLTKWSEVALRAQGFEPEVRHSTTRDSLLVHHYHFTLRRCNVSISIELSYHPGSSHGLFYVASSIVPTSLGESVVESQDSPPASVTGEYGASGFPDLTLTTPTGELTLVIGLDFDPLLRESDKRDLCYVNIQVVESPPESPASLAHPSSDAPHADLYGTTAHTCLPSLSVKHFSALKRRLEWLRGCIGRGSLEAGRVVDGTTLTETRSR